MRWSGESCTTTLFFSSGRWTSSVVPRHRNPVHSRHHSSPSLLRHFRDSNISRLKHTLIYSQKIPSPNRPPIVTLFGKPSFSWTVQHYQLYISDPGYYTVGTRPKTEPLRQYVFNQSRDGNAFLFLDLNGGLSCTYSSNLSLLTEVRRVSHHIT